MFAGLYLRLALIGIIVAAIGGAYWYVTNLQNSLEEEKQNVIKLESAIYEQSRVIAQVQEDVRQQQTITTQLAQITGVQETELDDLRNYLTTTKTGESRDIGVLAKKKSKLMEKLFNRGTVNVTRCLELASGSKVKENESNKECPRYISNP